MKDKANGYRGINANTIRRHDIRNAKVIRSLAHDVDAFVLVSEVDRVIDLAKTNAISKADFLSAIERVQLLLPEFQRQFAVKDSKTGICSYSGFGGEKTGFALNAFSSRVSDTTKPRTNRDVKPDAPKVYKGRNARRRSWDHVAPEGTAPVVDTPANEKFLVSDEYKTKANNAATTRRERETAIREIQKQHADKFGNLLPRPDAVEIYRLRQL